MSRLESTETILAVVGVERHASLHIGRAVSADQRVYILHSEKCLATEHDLRNCKFSIALDAGIRMELWAHRQDVPVLLGVDPVRGDLIPFSRIGEGGAARD